MHLHLYWGSLFNVTLKSMGTHRFYDSENVQMKFQQAISISDTMLLLLLL